MNEPINLQEQETDAGPDAGGFGRCRRATPGTTCRRSKLRRCQRFIRRSRNRSSCG
jgi:hypothetical protein